MDYKSIIIWFAAGIGLFLLGSGLSGFSVYEQNCCLPSPFCQQVQECDHSSFSPNETQNVSKNMEFVILGLLVFILLLVLYNHTKIFKK